MRILKNLEEKEEGKRREDKGYGYWKKEKEERKGWENKEDGGRETKKSGGGVGQRAFSCIK
jgi:hypothetical protein